MPVCHLQNWYQYTALKYQVAISVTVIVVVREQSHSRGHEQFFALKKPPGQTNASATSWTNHPRPSTNTYLPSLNKKTKKKILTVPTTQAQPPTTSPFSISTTAYVGFKLNPPPLLHLHQTRKLTWDRACVKRGDEGALLQAVLRRPRKSTMLCSTIHR